MGKEFFPLSGKVSRANPQVVGSWGEQVHGPALVVVAGVHGNEPGGVIALTRLLQELEAGNGVARGRLVGYFDSRGIPALGFEGGQHESKAAVLFHLAILRLALVFTGILKEDDCAHFRQSMEMLEQSSRGLPRAHQVRHRHPVQPRDQFRMEPDLVNFQPVQTNQLLARDRKGEIRSPHSGRILMPLYQAQGDDGFFIVDPIELRAVDS